MKLSMGMVFIVGVLSFWGCTRQHDPRAYWAQYKQERIASNTQAPKLNADGTIPEVKVVKSAANGPGDAKFESLCSSCHGTDGAASSPAAAAMNPKPRNLTDAAWQSKVTDEHIAAVIKDGGGPNGLSPTMPAWGAVVNESEIADLVKKIRSLKK
jgi:mono/diheme cytochrome c family protein